MPQANGNHVAPRITRVKICCIADRAEAALAVRYGASAIGLVSSMPSGPGVISESTIADVAASVPPAVGSFLLTSRQSVPEIVAQQRRCGTNTVQLVDELLDGTYAELRRAMPGIAIVQVLHAGAAPAQEMLARACAIAAHVDALLLDSGNPHLAVKELGGTGRTHDWDTSAAICGAVDKPVFLVGGLRPGNVAAAIRHVRPYGVDVCSGVRTAGKLDESKLAAFVQAARSA